MLRGRPEDWRRRVRNKLALEKDRELRYQSASEMSVDLKRLRREIDSGRTGAVAAVSAAEIALGAPKTANGFGAKWS